MAEPAAAVAELGRPLLVHQQIAPDVAAFLDHLSDPGDRAKVARDNAEALFGLAAAPGPPA